MIDLLARNLRYLVRVTMGMPANSVLPANQKHPSGGETREWATVQIMDVVDAGQPIQRYEAVPSVHTDVAEAVQSVKQFTASVHFHGQPEADAAGQAKYSNAAFDRAAAIRQRLSLSDSILRMENLGIGFLSASPARDLTSQVDQNWRSHGQVDLTFNVVDEQRAIVPAINLADLELDFQRSDGSIATRTIEVIT